MCIRDSPHPYWKMLGYATAGDGSGFEKDERHVRHSVGKKKGIVEEVEVRAKLLLQKDRLP